LRLPAFVTLSLFASTLILGQTTAAPSTPVAPAKPAATAPQAEGDARSQLNLRNQTDTSSGESRRNENVNFNPIDNNALREVNLRLGATATVVEHFDPSRNYFSAEYGTRPPADVHVTGAPKPAARAIHGRLFATHRNSIFSARSFFQVGSVRPARENNYGFTISSPLWRDAFLTLDASQQKARGNVNGNVLVPNANERTPLTTDPSIRPLVERYLAAYPAELPNRTDIDDRALNTNSPQRIDTDRAGVALDQKITAKDRLFLRYNATLQNTRAFQFVAGQNPDSNVRAHAARATWSRAFSPSTVADLSLGFDRLGTVLRPEANAVAPILSIFIIQRQGSPAVPVNRAINEYRYAGKVQRTAPRHSVAAGFTALRRQFNGQEANDHLGTFYFGDAFGRDAVSNVRMGTPFRFTMAIGNTARGFRNWETSSFVSDTWRVSSRLTLRVGLRWETFSKPVEVNGLDTMPFACDCNNIAPTAGFAYRLPAGGVLRGAYGIHFGRIFPATYGQMRFNPPGVISLNVDNPNLANPLAGINVGALPAGTRTGITSIASELASPYSHQYNFSWEPALPGSQWLRVQLGYVGSRTHKLLATWTMNRAKPVDGIPLTTATVNQRRPDGRYFGVARVLNGSRAWYDAARASIVIPQRHGWSFDASYWFSKSIDLGSDYSATGAGATTPSQSDWYIHQDTKGLSNFQQPHAFLARASYESPRKRVPRVLQGWRTSAVLLMKTGTPFSVFSGSDAPGFGNVDGESGDRVNILDPSILGRVVANPDTSRALLPRSAFAFMNPGDLRGNIGRNTFRKGGIRNVNAVLDRSWRVGGEYKLRFRAESVNLGNTPQFADPERNLTSKTFGLITNTLNEGRTFQFTLQFDF
jgi:hypothetical protein